MPDVIVSLSGLRCIIEGKMGDAPNAHKQVEDDARDRIANGIGHIAIGIVYPIHLREATFSNLSNAIASATLDFIVWSEAGGGEWRQGVLDSILEELRRVYDTLVNDDILERSVKQLQFGMQSLENVLFSSRAACGRLADILGVYRAEDTPGVSQMESEEILMPSNEEKRLYMAARLAALTLANAFIAQAELAEVDSNVRPLRETLAERDPVNALAIHWQFICDTINYVPIFNLARQVLLQTPPRKEVYQALRELGKEVLAIVAERAALRHDLMGRIYHRLLLEAKYLGTFYTSVPAATLLLKLALAPERWKIDWSSVDALNQLRIADLACGTGTLLMAAQQVITDNYIKSSVSEGKSVDASRLTELHRGMMQNVLHGYDVLVSAVHLTASTLAMLAPEIAFRKMHLYCMPLGEQVGNKLALGSIEFLSFSSLPTQLDLMGEVDLTGTAQVVTGTGNEASEAPLPMLDLCVMNPPFVRSVGGNLLFGSLPNNVRNKMQHQLQTLLSTPDAGGRPVLASSTAGLGSVFVAVANPHVKPNGRIALVLPAALATGVAWEKTRKLFARDYVVELIVVSHDPSQWNFSENTSLSEILVIARKRISGEQLNGFTTACVNLWRNTKTPIDALALADAILSNEPADVEPAIPSQNGVTSIEVNGVKRGEMVRSLWSSIANNQWYTCSFAQTDLVRVSHFLRKGKVYSPVDGGVVDLPLLPLKNLGALGPDRRDIYDGFEQTASQTNYPALWEHKAEMVKSLEIDPNLFLSPRNTPLPNRPRRSVSLLWPRAGRIMLAERLRLNTQRLVAVRLPTLALSNVWWPFHLYENDENVEKALELWLNSTPGIISLLSCRVSTEGSWVQFKKPVLEQLLVLDVRKLLPEQIQQLVEIYNQAARTELLPLSKMLSDNTREIIDNAIADVLGLPSFDMLRQSLAREPMIFWIALVVFIPCHNGSLSSS